jgi:hypothetical protein
MPAKTARVELVMTDAEKLRLTEVASREGRSVGGLLRWLVTRYEVQCINERNAR